MTTWRLSKSNRHWRNKRQAFKEQGRVQWSSQKPDPFITNIDITEKFGFLTGRMIHWTIGCLVEWVLTSDWSYTMGVKRDPEWLTTDGCEVFNVGRATHWAFSEGLGVNPKTDPETIGLAILILRQVARPSLCQIIVWNLES